MLREALWAFIGSGLTMLGISQVIRVATTPSLSLWFLIPCLLGMLISSTIAAASTSKFVYWWRHAAYAIFHPCHRSVMQQKECQTCNPEVLKYCDDPGRERGWEATE